MKKSFLWDNDVLYKCTILNLWEDFFLQKLTKEHKHFYLESCRFIFKKSLNETGENIQRLDDQLSKMKIVEKLVDEEEIELFSNQVGIDPGEAFFFAKMKEGDFLLMTGDKKSLEALKEMNINKQTLYNKIILWEDLLYETLQRMSEEKIIERFKNLSFKDIFLRVVFSMENLKSKERILDAINHYRRDSRKSFGEFLVDNSEFFKKLEIRD